MRIGRRHVICEVYEIQPCAGHTTRDVLRALNGGTAELMALGPSHMARWVPEVPGQEPERPCRLLFVLKGDNGRPREDNAIAKVWVVEDGPDTELGEWEVVPGER